MEPVGEFIEPGVGADEGALCRRRHWELAGWRGFLVHEEPRSRDRSGVWLPRFMVWIVSIHAVCVELAAPVHSGGMVQFESGDGLGLICFW